MERDTFDLSQGIATLPPDKASLSTLLRSLGEVDRPKLETIIEAAIDAIDELDGDPDLENYDADQEDDDPGGQCSEDEISCGPGHWGGYYQRATGPGCPLGDPCGDEPEHGCPDRYHGEDQTLIFSHRHHRSGAQSIDQWPNSST